MRHTALAAGLLLGLLCCAQAQELPGGRAVYDVQCASCHAAGILGSPRTGDAAAWAPRLAAGKNALYAVAIKGKGGMPARGGNAELTDAQVIAAVNHMLNLPDAGGTASAKQGVVTKTAATTEDAAQGRAVYQASCAACHGTGAAGAPRLGDSAAWKPRLNAGIRTLQANAIKGKGAMPPKGGNAALADAAVRAAVDFMLAQARAGASTQAAAQTATPVLPPLQATAPLTTDSSRGRTVYQASCAACHATGAAGAPRLGDGIAWIPRLNAGIGALHATALKGKGAMPPKGGNASLTDADVRAAVDFMVAQARGAATGSAAANSSAPAAAVSAPVASGIVAPGPVMQAANDPNTFNRLMIPPARRNASPAEDGIHDPASPGTLLLQAPATSFATLPRSNTGNYVNWGDALDKKQIQPRWDARDPRAVATVMDLNIVREVKGSMPDVVFPHKQHTEWLDCSNCHPAIFVPQKGANQISMAAIMLGQKCGVCHGKVAFPVSECRLCHSRAKTTQTAGEGKR